MADTSPEQAPALAVTRLRCEYGDRPLALDTPAPRLSWILDAAGRRDARQGAYQIEVSRTEGGPPDLWDGGRVASEQSVLVPYGGEALESGERAWWRVRAWDWAGDESPWSGWAWWERGLGDRADWRGGWVGGPLAGGPKTTVPSPYLRRAFTVEKPVRRARLYATALGLYEPWLNGRRVGDLALSPGWTDYGRRVHSQAYDVTEFLAPGPNALGAVLGDGWYCGHVGWEERQQYGDRPRLLAQINVEYEDGARDVLAATGDGWRVAFGPLLESDLLMGGSFDARLSLGDWCAAGYDDGAWAAAARLADPGIEIRASPGPPIRPQEVLAAVAAPAQTPNGWVYDLGQNMVGRVRLKVSGERGRTLTLRHGEVLTPEGHLYTENLRKARARDVYTLAGGGEEVWEPRFTFHGFRYVEVSGYDGTPPRDLISGVVLHSDFARSGDFSCSDPLINQLQSNIVWGLKGNFLDVPTDCPQRDERLGWTGDAQVFCETAAGIYDVSGFFAKWLRDVADAQTPDGGLPMFAPLTRSSWAEGGPGWADAGIICAWTQYARTGDLGLLTECYPMLTRWMGQQRATSQDGVRVAGGGWPGFGDWLALDGSGVTEGRTPKDLIGTAFFAHAAARMAQIARVLGKPEDAETYDALAAEVRAAFGRSFAPNGVVAADTQTAHVLALHFGLLPEGARAGAADWLARDIKARGDHLATGFLGTPYLMSVLTEAGHLDTAYALLMQKTWPSWLYPVTLGATTIWERWDGWTEDGGFQDVGMNSFNHYAYGAIGAWLYATVAGLAFDPARPGGAALRLRPRPGGGLTQARASLETPYGPAASDWRIKDGRFLWTVTVPPSSTATVQMPPEAGESVVEVAAGVYEYDLPWQPDV